MSTIGDGADGASKLLAVVKDVPFWVLAGCAAGADVMLFVPAISSELPKDFRSWLIVFAVLSNILAVARVIDISLGVLSGLRKSRAAKRTFHLSSDDLQARWSTHKQRDDSMTTQINAWFLVKNLTDAPLGLVALRLIKPKIHGEVFHASIAVRPEDSHTYGSAAHSGYRIGPRSIAPAVVSLMIRGVPPLDAAKVLHATFGIADDEGNEQRIKIALKGSPPPSPTMKAEGPTERAFMIGDPIEKEVVSVLQSEVGRYDKHGRDRGAFGSIHIEHNGRHIAGFANDGWNPDSPKNQILVGDPEGVRLASDNLASLLKMYERLQTDAERGIFVTALLDRLDADKGYLRVSYFIVCGLWKTGSLEKALQKARGLPEDEKKVFGLSNVLFMMNGLLRYRHPDFTAAMLDQLESFVHDLKREHSFMILEKIAAIRTERLLQPLPQ